MIKVFIHNKGYDIQHNGEMIVKCVEPFVPFKDLLINLGFDLNVERVEIHEGDNITDGAFNNTEDSDDIDSVIKSMNNSFSAPNLGKYKQTFDSNDDKDDNVQSSLNDNTNSKKQESKKESNVPVGSVECPNEGDLIYVDGIVGVLSKITGGVGTVMTIYKSNDPITIYTENASFDEDDDYEDYEDDDYEDQNICENNILVELEEVPGHYFSWSLLRSKQDALQKKYGYKPVCKL